MKQILFSLLLALLLASPSLFAQSVDQCYACHFGSVGDAPSTLFQNDVHRKKGITCADCHGGNSTTDDMEQAMNKKGGYLGVPTGDAVSQTCARCHSSADQMKKYGSAIPISQFEKLETSVHGKLSVSGKEHIAQCTTCHNAHGIVSPKDVRSPVNPLNVVKTCSRCHSNASYMRLYNPSVPVDQQEKYRTSVHGMRNAKGDRKAAECASCHGSHDIRTVADARSPVYATNLPTTCAKCHSNAEYMKEYKIPTDQYAKFAESVHGIALLEKKDVGAPACNDCHGNHGATPPGVESVSKVCGTCHALNADLFSSSPHKKVFDARNLPECETCHGNHQITAATEKLLGAGPEAVCSRCHSERENSKGFAVAKSMRAGIDSLESSAQFATRLVEEAEQKGMEVGEAKFKLRDARQARLESRTMVHAFNGERFQEVVQKGLAATAFVASEGQAALDEYLFRRFGLGIATLIITIMAVALYLYIKRLERSQR